MDLTADSSGDERPAPQPASSAQLVCTASHPLCCMRMPLCRENRQNDLYETMHGTCWTQVSPRQNGYSSRQASTSIHRQPAAWQPTMMDYASPQKAGQVPVANDQSPSQRPRSPRHAASSSPLMQMLHRCCTMHAQSHYAPLLSAAWLHHYPQQGVLTHHRDIASSVTCCCCRAQQQQTALLPQQQAQPVQAFGAAASLLTGSTAGNASSAAVTQPSAAQQAASRHLSPARRSRQETGSAVNLWPESQWPTRCITVAIPDSVRGWPYLHRYHTGKSGRCLLEAKRLRQCLSPNPADTS